MSNYKLRLEGKEIDCDDDSSVEFKTVLAFFKVKEEKITNPENHPKFTKQLKMYLERKGVDLNQEVIINYGYIDGDFARGLKTIRLTKFVITPQKHQSDN